MEAIQVVKSAGTPWRVETHYYWWLRMFCFQDFIQEIVLTENHFHFRQQLINTKIRRECRSVWNT